MQPLHAKSLSSLSAPVSTPTYERDRVRTGIVHFGVGGFHQSHQAMYLDRLMGAVALAEPVRLDRGWCLGSDGEGKFSEGCRKLMSRVDVGGEFVVAAAEVLHERVP